MIMEQKLCVTCVALAVLVFAMAVPQGTALARSAKGGGMDVRTADLCLVDDAEDTDLLEYDSGGIGTVAAVTDRRFGVTAWAVSLEGMQETTYEVYDTGSEDFNCEGGNSPVPPFFVYPIPTDVTGEAFINTEGDNPNSTPDVGDVIQICRCDLNILGECLKDEFDEPILIRILEGVLVKGGKEQNKPGRCVKKR